MLRCGKYGLFTIRSKIDKSKLDHKIIISFVMHFAFWGSLVMDDYFGLGLVNQLNKHTNKSTYPETILYNHLKSNNIRYKTLDIDYGFVYLNAMFLQFVAILDLENQPSVIY